MGTEKRFCGSSPDLATGHIGGAQRSQRKTGMEQCREALNALLATMAVEVMAVASYPRAPCLFDAAAMGRLLDHAMPLATVAR
jgi:hypothetical protein